MSKYRGVARDEFGNALNGASVTIYEADGTTAATIYSDTELATAESNPLTTGSDGVYEFYAYPGYYDVQVAKTGYTTTTLSNEVIGTSIASCTGANAGSIAPGVTPDEIGNTALGGVHLATQWVSNEWTVDVDTGRYTYTGDETIIVEAIASVAVQTTVAGTVGIYAYKNFAVTATIFGRTIFQCPTGSQYSGNAVGIAELDTNDYISFGINTSGGGTLSMYYSNYIIKRIG
jgi:hypothetical protein